MPENSEFIKLKGAADGVKLYLSPDGTISDISNSLYEKLSKYRSFFRNANYCNIYIVGRELGDGDKLRLEAIMKAMLPQCEIIYGDRKNPGSGDIEKTLELSSTSPVSEAVPEVDYSDMEELREVYDANFKSGRTRLFEGSVKSGTQIRSDRHIVIVGDVEEGGQVISTGNVIVLGSLRGSVYAGIMGSNDAYIIALDFASSDIGISTRKHIYIEKDDFTGGSKKAYLSGDRVVCEAFPPTT